MTSSKLFPSIERSQKRTKRITWSALAGLASSGAVAFVSIFSAPITINYLGKDLYGIWVIITSFLVWVQLFDFGILNGLTNALSEAFGRDDYTLAQKHICTSFFSTALISGLMIIPWIVATSHIPWSEWIKVDTVEQGYLLGRGICIVGCFFFLTMPFIQTQGILHASQRYYFTHIIHFIAYLLTLLALIMGVYFRFDLLDLLVIVNSLPLIWHILCWLILNKRVAWARFSWKHVNYPSLKRVAHSSIPILSLQIMHIISSQMVPVLLSFAATLKDVADFSILWKMYVFLFFMMTNISTAYNPGIREAFERGEINWIKTSLRRLLFIQIGLILVGGLPLLFIGNEIVEMWIRMPLEHPFGNIGWLIYVFFVLLMVLNSTLNGVLLILDKTMLPIVLSFSSSIILIIGIMWGVPKVGIIAVFLILGSTAFISVICGIKTLRRKLNTRIRALKAECADSF